MNSTHPDDSDDTFAGLDGGFPEGETAEGQLSRDFDEYPAPHKHTHDAGDCRHAGDLDSNRLYLRDTHRYPRLSDTDAVRCARAMRQATEKIAAGAPSAAKRAVIARASRRMIQGSLGLVVAIARTYEHQNLSLSDLIQEGNLGLMSAVRRFDPERRVRFSAYATGWIRQAMCRALSQQSRTIRIPLAQLALRRQAARVHGDLEQRYCNEACCGGGHRRSPTTEDDARTIGVDPARLRETLRALPDLQSLDAPTRNGTPLAAVLSDERATSPLDEAAAAEQRRRLRTAIDDLPFRLGYVVRRRYGLAGDNEASLADIGQELHLTPERVRQLEKRARRLLALNPLCSASAP